MGNYPVVDVIRNIVSQGLCSVICLSCWQQPFFSLSNGQLMQSTRPLGDTRAASV